MTYKISHRLCLRLLLPFILTILLSGCIRGLIEREKTSTTPNVSKVTVSAKKNHQQPGKPQQSNLNPKTYEQPLNTTLSGTTILSPSTNAKQKILPQKLDFTPTPLTPTTQTTSGQRFEIPPPSIIYRDMLLTEDILWEGEILVEGWVTVAPQATLTISPGTIIRFGNNAAGVHGGLLVQGRIMAIGTQTSPILFTANFVEPEACDWQGIVLLSSEKKNLIEHVRIRGAETGLDAYFSTVKVASSFFNKCRKGLRLQDTLITLTGGKISSCDLGISLYDSEVDLRNTDIDGNRLGAVTIRTSLAMSGITFNRNIGEALTVNNSRISIVGTNFTSNGSGVRLTACNGIVTNCRLNNNDDYGLFMTRSRVKVNNNDITGNGSYGLLVEDGQGIAWGNRFGGNGKYDVYNAGIENFRAIANWWNTSANNLQSRIYDRQTNGNHGRVYFLPVLKTKPLPLP